MFLSLSNVLPYWTDTMGGLPYEFLRVQELYLTTIDDQRASYRIQTSDVIITHDVYYMECDPRGEASYPPLREFCRLCALLVITIQCLALWN